MSKENIILIGGGGHCKSCIDVIEQEGKYSIAGIIDIPANLGNKILGYEIIGNDNDLPAIAKEFNYFLITIGQIRSVEKRIKLFEKIKGLKINIPFIISPYAYISKHSVICEGTIIMHHALINANAVIGSNCIINSKSLIEHDAIIGDHCHISTGAIVNGGAKINNGTFFGSGAVCKENIEIPENSFIKANSIVYF
jgi:sugar O-acyltransferase (sialic acid O-acetyltransferase NeuD family)